LGEREEDSVIVIIVLAEKDEIFVLGNEIATDLHNYSVGRLHLGLGGLGTVLSGGGIIAEG
jgi:hypothetical protein